MLITVTNTLGNPWRTRSLLSPVTFDSTDEITLCTRQHPHTALWTEVRPLTENKKKIKILETISKFPLTKLRRHSSSFSLTPECRFGMFVSKVLLSSQAWVSLFEWVRGFYTAFNLCNLEMHLTPGLALAATAEYRIKDSVFLMRNRPRLSNKIHQPSISVTTADTNGKWDWDFPLKLHPKEVSSCFKLMKQRTLNLDGNTAF